MACNLQVIDLLPTGSEERGVLGVGSITYRIVTEGEVTMANSTRGR